jgi:hypothetical protein
MSVKAILAMVFWVILQITLIMPGLSQVAADCAPLVTSCECCAGMESCPCAGETDPAPVRQPIAPESGQSLKVPLARISDPTTNLVNVPCRKHGTETGPRIVTATTPGYAGVSLAVAFCSFVI